MLNSFDFSHIRLDGVLGERIRRTIDNNLLKLDLEKEFVSPFQRKQDADGVYYALGKNMDCLVHFASIDPRIIPLKKKIFDLVIATQEPDGYIGSMVPGHRVWEPWDCHDENYIALALFNDYFRFGEEKSREAGRKLLDYLLKAWPQKPKTGGYYGWLDDHMVTLGIEHAMLSGYEATGDVRYLDFVRNECGLASLDWPIQQERHAPLHGHIYCYMSHAAAQLRLALLTGAEPVSPLGRTAEDFLFHRGGMGITGGAGKCECWTSDQNGFGDYTETCSSAYLIRYLALRLRLTRDAFYGDVIERILYNSLFAAQSPDGRRIRYSTPFEGKRIYMNIDSYCCPGNFRRMISELPQLAAFHSDDELFVNLYSDMTIDAEFAGVPVKLSAKGNYPAEETVEFTIRPARPVEFALNLRIPRWCSDPLVTVSGMSLRTERESGFLAIRRTWQDGDKVVLRLPMPIRFVRGERHQYRLGAAMRGPVVYTLNPANVYKGGKSARARFSSGENFLADDSGKTSLADFDTAQLREIRLDQDSARLAPDGAIEVIGDRNSNAIDVTGNCVFRLTPFEDPEGRSIYFHLDKPERAVPDELLLIE